MTTCIYKDGILAADRLGTMTEGPDTHCPKCDSELTVTLRKNGKKISISPTVSGSFRGEKILAVAHAGGAKTAARFEKAFSSDVGFEKALELYALLSDTPLPSLSYILVTEKSVFLIELGNNSVDVSNYTRQDVVAIGSGGDAAIALCNVLGIGAINAVALVSETDKYTGNTVSYVDFSDPEIKLMKALFHGDTVARTRDEVVLEKAKEISKRNATAAKKTTTRAKKGPK